MVGMPQLLSVFFPSLSRDILWKLGAVSRVRSAAQKRAPYDTAPTFHKILRARKRREGVANRNHELGGLPAAQTQTVTPPTLAYCGRKMVLTMGSTLGSALQN